MRRGFSQVLEDGASRGPRRWGIKLGKIDESIKAASARSGLLRHAALQALQSRIYFTEAHVFTIMGLPDPRHELVLKFSASGQENVGAGGGSRGRCWPCAYTMKFKEENPGWPQGRRARDGGWSIRTNCELDTPNIILTPNASKRLRTQFSGAEKRSTRIPRPRSAWSMAYRLQEIPGRSRDAGVSGISLEAKATLAVVASAHDQRADRRGVLAINSNSTTSSRLVESSASFRSFSIPRVQSRAPDWLQRGNHQDCAYLRIRKQRPSSTRNDLLFRFVGHSDSWFAMVNAGCRARAIRVYPIKLAAESRAVLVDAASRTVLTSASE